MTGRIALAGAAYDIWLAAQPAAADDFEDCTKALGDAAIAACTRTIDSGTYRGRDLATLFNNRGIRLARKGEPDRAIADYGEAIRLDPTNATPGTTAARLGAPRAITTAPSPT